ncbi:MAG TPA: hypothetical protein VHL78_02860 [Actinomycetota bacterium]|nr:hypothetical protein [Actinomycetota bacterium]
MPRYDLPADLSPEDQRAVIAALERAMAAARPRPAPWALAGRVEALRLGALQARHHAAEPWTLRAHVPFARAGTSPLVGRGDAK